MIHCIRSDLQVASNESALHTDAAGPAAAAAAAATAAPDLTKEVFIWINVSCDWPTFMGVIHHFATISKYVGRCKVAHPICNRAQSHL